LACFRYTHWIGLDCMGDLFYQGVGKMRNAGGKMWNDEYESMRLFISKWIITGSDRRSEAIKK